MGQVEKKETVREREQKINLIGIITTLSTTRKIHLM